jgi:hypothetical protein
LLTLALQHGRLGWRLAEGDGSAVHPLYFAFRSQRFQVAPGSCLADREPLADLSDTHTLLAGDELQDLILPIQAGDEIVFHSCSQSIIFNQNQSYLSKYFDRFQVTNVIIQDRQPGTQSARLSLHFLVLLRTPLTPRLTISGAAYLVLLAVLVATLPFALIHNPQTR